MGLSSLLPNWAGKYGNENLFFKISLGEYSLNALQAQGKHDTLEVPALAKKEFGIDAVEWVSFFWKKGTDKKFLNDLKQRCVDNDVKSLVILVDIFEAQLADLEKEKRNKAIELHKPWIEAAAFLGCHSIRVNTDGFGLNGYGQPGNKEEVGKAAVEGYGKVVELSEEAGINAIIQNHTGYTCDPDWLVNVLEQVKSPHAGTQVDPDHFEELFIKSMQPKLDIVRGSKYDRYDGIKKLMPYAKAVNAKAIDFDKNGNELHTDYAKFLEIVKNSGYTGYIGIEWEGKDMDSYAGIKATQNLLIKEGKKLS
jgi:sugar phosphate isomerase/epimerase